MNAATINRLSWYKPRTERPAATRNDLNLELPEIPGIEDTLHYLEAYKNLRFGWDLVSELVRLGEDMPTLIEGDDLWLWRAYMHLKGYFDPAVDGAVRITFNRNSWLRQQLQNCFVNKLVSHADVASMFNLPLGVVQAFEKLFYNIVDRRSDTKFLAETVYPDTRMVELFEHYMQDETFGNLLMRTSYNNGPKELLYFIGMCEGSPYEVLRGHESATRLEALIMAQGYLLTKAGFGNQRQHAALLGRSQQLLTAAKQSGVDSQDQSPFALGLGDAIRDMFESDGRQEAETRIRRSQMLEAEVLEEGWTLQDKQRNV